MGIQFLSFQPIIITILTSIFTMLCLMRKDELEECAFSNALKTSTFIIVIAIFLYSMHSLVLGKIHININDILVIVELLEIATIILYFLEIKGFVFKLAIENEFLIKALLWISIGISVLSTISIILKVSYFENKVGFIRNDEMISFINLIVTSILITMLPKGKKLSYKEYKENEKELNKSFKIMIAVYIVVMIIAIPCIIYIKIK